MYRPVLIAVLSGAAAMAAVTNPTPGAMLPAGTNIPCRIDQSLDTEHDTPGTPFTGRTTIDIVHKGAVLVPRGAVCHGHLAQSKTSGKLKGRARMQLSLDSIQFGGHVYPVTAPSAMLASKSHKKHNLKWIGGGGAGGTAIGAIAGGGVGALVGGAIGAAGGTAGAALTGEKNVRVPAESQFIFTLSQPVHLVR
jgi:hypothetical protein